MPQDPEKEVEDSERKTIANTSKGKPGDAVERDTSKKPVETPDASQKTASPAPKTTKIDDKKPKKGKKRHDGR